MKSIKTSLSSKLVTLLAGAALFGLVSQSALALTASGTVISNTASLGYTVGGVTQTGITSAAATFTVDKKVDLLVAATDVAAVSVNPGQVGAVTTFTVTNNGNDTQDFGLAAGNVASGQVVLTKTDNFDGTGLQVFVENGLAAGYQSSGANQDTATYIDELAPGASKTVYVLSSIPLAQVSGDVSAVYLRATAEAGGSVGSQGAALVATVGANTAGVDIVFADAAGTDDTTGARDGQHSARDAYQIASAILSVSKTAALICDPVNGNGANRMNIPGAAVQYAITITNGAAATASATLSQITDTLVAALAFDPKLNSGALPAANCVSGNVANTLSATGFGAVSGTGTTTTTYAAPGLAGQAVTAGASVAGQNVTINFATLASPTYGLVGGVLPANSFVTVYFNAFVQ